MDRREALKRTALLGGAAASTSLLGLLQACQQQPRLGWQPVFLSMDHARLVAALVDTILPATATPGGLDVKVDLFIDLVYARTYDAAGQQQVVEDLEAFNSRAAARFGKPFADLEADQRRAFLQEEEAGAPPFNPRVWGTAVGKQAPVGFYRGFKSTAVWAYCSTETIGKNQLNYDPIPGAFRGCVPLSEVGRVWSL